MVEQQKMKWKLHHKVTQLGETKQEFVKRDKVLTTDCVVHP